MEMSISELEWVMRETQNLRDRTKQVMDRHKLINLLMRDLPDDNPWMGEVVKLVDMLEAEGFAFVTRCEECEYIGRNGCKHPRFRIEGHADPTMMASDFCSLGEKRETP